MAGTTEKRTRKNSKQVEDKIKVSQAEVIASTMDVEPEADAETGEKISIAVSLPHGIKFDDVPNGAGGTKTVVFPGVNDALRGKKSGVLALPGNAVCVQILKRDWEAIKAMHGREIAFVGRNGRMPCIYPVGDVKGFKSARSEIEEMRHGLEPIEPVQAGVEEKTDKKE